MPNLQLLPSLIFHLTRPLTLSFRTLSAPLSPLIIFRGKPNHGLDAAHFSPVSPEIFARPGRRSARGWIIASGLGVYIYSRPVTWEIKFPMARARHDLAEADGRWGEMEGLHCSRRFGNPTAVGSMRISSCASHLSFALFFPTNSASHLRANRTHLLIASRDPSGIIFQFGINPGILSPCWATMIGLYEWMWNIWAIRLRLTWKIG